MTGLPPRSLAYDNPSFSFFKNCKTGSLASTESLSPLRKPGSLLFFRTFEKATKPYGFDIILYLDE
jgi:hypothetical protein